MLDKLHGTIGGEKMIIERIRKRPEFKVSVMILVSIANIFLTLFLHSYALWNMNIRLLFIGQSLVCSVLTGWLIGETRREKIIRGLLFFGLLLIIWEILMSVGIYSPYESCMWDDDGKCR